MQSGTSVDGIDVAIVDVVALDDSRRPMVSMTPVAVTTVHWSTALRERLLAAVHGAALTAGEFCELDTLAGQEFGRAAADAAAALPADDAPIDLVACHGQTLFHWAPHGHARGTLQIGDAAWIAEATGAPTLAGVRSADIAAGGEGAPLMGVFDAAWLGARAAQSGEPLATVNLGGIANVQIVSPDGTLVAFDSGPANAMIDAVVERTTGGASACDEDGRMAAAGRTIRPLLNTLRAHPYFVEAAPKTTGRETFTLGLLDAGVAESGCEHITPEDLVATLTELTARTVTDALVAGSVAGRAPSSVIVSGGGVHNPALMAALTRACGDEGIAVSSSADHGIDPDAKETYLFALIGFLSWHGVPSALPATPRGRERVLGHLLFGAHPVHLPQPLLAIAGLQVHSGHDARRVT